MIKFIFTQMSKELVGKSKKVALEVSNKKMRERTPLSMPSESTVKFKKKKETVSSRKTTNGHDNQSLEGTILWLRKRKLLLECTKL